MRKSRLPLLFISALGIASTLSVRSPPAHSQSEDAESLESSSDTSAALARHDAWVAAMQSAMAVPSPVVETVDCPDGLTPWRRADIDTICVSACEVDEDCEADERCRVISYALGAAAPTLTSSDLAIATADGEVSAVADGEDDEVSAVEDAEAIEAFADAIDVVTSSDDAFGVCDPFWDSHGALSSVD